MQITTSSRNLILPTPPKSPLWDLLVTNPQRATIPLTSNGIYYFCIFLMFHINTIIKYILFHLWLLSSSIMFVRNTHMYVVAVCSFLLLYTNIPLFTLLLIGIWNSFQFWTATNGTSMNILLHVFWWTRVCISVGYTLAWTKWNCQYSTNKDSNLIPQSGITGS